MAMIDHQMMGSREKPSPKNATPLYVVDDISSAQRRFSAMGFEMFDTSDNDRVGMRAGESRILLMDETKAQRALPPEVMASLKHGPALFVWVDSIDETRSRIADPVIAEMVTGYGTWELFVESRIGLIIFAEKLTKGETSNFWLS
ncbi:MAG: hypothetical protein DHS20C08_24960 [Rhodomicrobium sp.]|nr:MAG: hypothetical protein DHS20C08_24960 [Rhodomicrobium sp.]